MATILSALVAAIGLFMAWRSWRESALRRGEVLAWANEVIAALEGLLLVCLLSDEQLSTEQKKEKLVGIIFSTSTLVERGRIFFKNEVVDDWGSEKEPAYRGYRPKILDPVIVAYQIACGWGSADTEERLRMRIVAEDCLKKFVSLAQYEVGRSRTASTETRKGGDGAHLRHVLDAVDADRLEELQRQTKKFRTNNPNTKDHS